MVESLFCLLTILIFTKGFPTTNRIVWFVCTNSTFGTGTVRRYYTVGLRTGITARVYTIRSYDRTPLRYIVPVGPTMYDAFAFLLIIRFVRSDDPRDPTWGSLLLQLLDIDIEILLKKPFRIFLRRRIFSKNSSFILQVMTKNISVNIYIY